MLEKRRTKLKILSQLAVYAISIIIAAPAIAAPTNAVDHDADGKADYTVFRPSDPGFGNALWYVNSSALSSTLVYQWGLLGDKPIRGNFSNGAGLDLAVYRPSEGNWYIRNYTSDLKYNVASKAYQWGFPEDTPIACDFDGDSGRSDISVYRPSNGVWYVRRSSGIPVFETATATQWGGFPGDIPIPRDYDSDGKCDYTVYRNGSWFVLLSSENNGNAGVIPWGAAGDVPIPGKYDADNIVDLAVYRPSNSVWYIRKSTLAGLTSRAIAWGLPGDLPVPADYTGDGKTDIAVWRPLNGTYYVLTSESNYVTAVAQQFGRTGDIPIVSIGEKQLH